MNTRNPKKYQKNKNLKVKKGTRNIGKKPNSPKLTNVSNTPNVLEAPSMDSTSEGKNQEYFSKIDQKIYERQKINEPIIITEQYQDISRSNMRQKYYHTNVSNNQKKKNYKMDYSNREYKVNKREYQKPNQLHINKYISDITPRTNISYNYNYMNREIERGPNIMPFVFQNQQMMLEEFGSFQHNLSHNVYVNYMENYKDYEKEKELVRFRNKLMRFNKIMNEINEVMDKIRFPVVSIFRTRMGYQLKEFELNYLMNVERTHKYFVFLFLFNSYKETLTFYNENDNLNENVLWEFGKFRNLINEESDLSLVSTKLLLFKGIFYKYPKYGNQSKHIVLRWDMESFAYLFNDNELVNKESGLLVLIKMINIKILIDNLEMVNKLDKMYENITENLIKLIGYYTLVCSDDNYILIISNLIPKLSEKQKNLLYYQLGLLLEADRCNLQLYYLERFIDRILPICLSQDNKSWKFVVNNIINVIDPIKLNKTLDKLNRKYVNCYISLIRTLKSFSNTFVKCPQTSYNIFIICIKYLVCSLDDSKVLIKSESTDLLIQIFLHNYSCSETGDNVPDNEVNDPLNWNIANYMNYDVIKILGSLSGVQSIKLNIWSYLLSSCENTLSNGEDSAQVCKPVNVLSALYSKEPKVNVVNLVNNCEFKSGIDNDINILSLTSVSEFVYLFNLLSYLEKINMMQSKDKNKLKSLSRDQYNKLKSVVMGWFLKTYLKINKESLQYEKLSIVVRILYLIYKYFLLTKFNHSSSDIGREGMTKILYYFINNFNVSNLNFVIEYVVTIMTNRIDDSNCCLELANVKLSAVLDLLFFNYKFNFDIINNTNEPFNILLDDDNSVKLLENLFDNYLSKLCTLPLNDLSFEFKDNLCIDNLLENKFNFLNCDRSIDFKFESLLKVLMNVSTLVHFVNNNVTMLKVMLDYLSNSILYYNSDLSGVLCLNTISSFVVTSLVYIYYYINLTKGFDYYEQLMGTECNVLKELNNLISRTFLYKIMLIYNVNVSNLRIDMSVMYNSYRKLLINESYDGDVTKFILLNSYILTLEYLCNLNYYRKRKCDALNLSKFKHLDVMYVELLVHISAIGDNSNGVHEEYLTNCVNSICSNNYKLPNYFLNYATNGTFECGKCCFIYINEPNDSNSFGCLIEFISNALVLNVNQLALIKFLVLIYSKNEMILYEFVYYISTLAFLIFYNNNINNLETNNEMTDIKQIYILKIKLMINMFNELINVLSKLLNKSNECIFNDIIASVYNGNVGCNFNDFILRNELYGMNAYTNFTLILKILLTNKLLWDNFKCYPIILSTLIKLLSINELCKFLGQFIMFNPMINNEQNLNLNYIVKDYNFYCILLYYLINHNKSDNTFRYYFLYIQLLVRITEVGFFFNDENGVQNNEIIKNRNFYNNFNIKSPVIYDQLKEFEYLTKDIVLYLLNDKKITSDNNLVCYIGNNNNKSLFIYYMNGYNLNKNYEINNEINNIIIMLLIFMKHIINFNDIRLEQVILFSLYPILIHIIPNKFIFNHLYEILIASTGRNDSNDNSKLFIEFLLLNVLMNWYSKYFFIYNFFIDNIKINNDLIEKYIIKFLNKTNNKIEFNFNFTNVTFPVQYVYQIQNLFS